MNFQLEYMCHVFVRNDSLAGVVISDHEYPSRVAHTLITKILNDFSVAIPIETWTKHYSGLISYPPLNTFLSKYQDPKECDALMKIQSELDETKIVLVIFFFQLLFRIKKNYHKYKYIFF